MEEVISRFPHLGVHIFESLKSKDLKKCKIVCKPWNYFIDNQKFPWIRIVKKYSRISNVNNSSKLCQKIMSKTKLEVLKKLAKSIEISQKNDYSIARDKDKKTLLHFVVDFLKGMYKMLVLEICVWLCTGHLSTGDGLGNCPPPPPPFLMNFDQNFS